MTCGERAMHRHASRMNTLQAMSFRSMRGRPVENSAGTGAAASSGRSRLHLIRWKRSCWSAGL